MDTQTFLIMSSLVILLCVLVIGLTSIGAKKSENTNLFFSSFSGAAGISPQNLGISHPKKFGFPVFEGHAELVVPHPFSRTS